MQLDELVRGLNEDDLIGLIDGKKVKGIKLGK